MNLFELIQIVIGFITVVLFIIAFFIITLASFIFLMEHKRMIESIMYEEYEEDEDDEEDIEAQYGESENSRRNK